MLYPTWKLKAFRLGQLLGALNQEPGAAPAAGPRSVVARLIDCVLEALSGQKSLANVLYVDDATGDGAEPTADQLQMLADAAAGATEAASGGVSESKAGGGGVSESKGGESAVATGVADTDADFALALKLAEEEESGAAAASEPNARRVSGAAEAVAGDRRVPSALRAIGASRVSSVPPVRERRGASGRACSVNPSCSPFALQHLAALAPVEPLLLQLYADEASAVTLSAGVGASPAAAAAVDFESRPNGVRPLLALLASNTVTRIREAVAAAGRRRGSGASQAPLVPFLRSAVKLLAAIQDEVAAAVGVPEGTDDSDADTADNGAPALSEIRAVSRFDMCNAVGWGYGGSADSIGFQVDTPVWISGFGLYGGSGEYTVKIYLVDGDGSSITDDNTVAKLADLTYDATTDEPAQLLFSSPVLIEADHRYTAFAEIRGGSSHSGGGGQSEREADDGVKFTFTGSSGSTNGSSVDSGQIPQILYQRELPKKGGAGGGKKAAAGSKPKAAAAAAASPPKGAAARAVSAGSVVGVGDLFGPASGEGDEEEEGEEDEEEEAKPEPPKPFGGFGVAPGGFVGPAAAAPFGGGFFGVPAPAPAVFGGFAAPAAPAFGGFGARAASPKGLFGAAPIAAPAFSFVVPAAAASPKPAFGGFGVAAAPAFGGAFGALAAPAVAKPAFVFGAAPPAPPPGGSIFGAPAAKPFSFGVAAPTVPAAGAATVPAAPAAAAAADEEEDAAEAAERTARADAAAQVARAGRLARFCALARAFLTHAATVLDVAAASSLSIAPEPHPGSDRVPLPRAVRAVIETDPVFGELLPRTLVSGMRGGAVVRFYMTKGSCSLPPPRLRSCTSRASSSRTRSPPRRSCRCSPT